jgi:segregation and condensation protein A
LFEGPLELLLHLCRRQELPLAQLPISEVTRQFLAYLEVLDALSLDVAGEFVETAALLCLLKSRELLPRIDVEEEEEEKDEEDLRADLVRRLLEYKSFQAAAAKLESLPRKDREFFVRPPYVASSSDEDAPLDCDLVDLLSALRDLLERGRKRAAVHEVAPSPLPLAERMAQVLARVSTTRGGLPLLGLFGDELDRAFIVVTFLAVLHLAYERRLRIAQSSPGEPILLEAA